MRTKQQDQLEQYCLCGNKITHAQRFDDAGLPCNKYCCGCCPHKNEMPCPKEKVFGTLTDNLMKIQTRVN